MKYLLFRICAGVLLLLFSFIPAFAQTVSSVVLDPNMVEGGRGTLGTVTLSSSAPASGLSVELAASLSAFCSVPATIIVPAGSTTAIFPVATAADGRSLRVEITASANNSSVSTALTIFGDGISSLTLAPATVIGGDQVSVGTVDLVGPAPAGGWTVELLSSAPTFAQLPVSITIPAGETSGSFSVTTSAYSRTLAFTITAHDQTTSRTASLTSLGDGIATVTVSPQIALAGQTCLATVTLIYPAPVSGWTVNLKQSSSSGVSVPNSVTIPQGASAVSFQITNTSQTLLTKDVLTASDFLTSVSADLTVASTSISTFQITPNFTRGGKPEIGTVTLAKPAPEGGWTVNLQSQSPSVVAVPSTITVPAGSISATFSVEVSPQSQLTNISITADDTVWPEWSEVTVAPPGGPWGVISDKTNNFDGSCLTHVAVGFYTTARTLHKNLSGQTLTELVLVYPNYRPSPSLTEAANLSALNVLASLQELGTAADQSQPRSIATFAGHTLGYLAPQATLFSDPIPCNIAPGASFYVYSAVAVASAPGTIAGNIPRGICTYGGTLQFGTDSGEGVASGKMMVASGTVPNNAATAIYSPGVILGRSSDGTTQPCVGIIGDSIAAGCDDAGYGYNYGGWPLRAFGNYPTVYLPFAGESLFQAANPINRVCRSQELEWCSTIVSNYGRNDLQKQQTFQSYHYNLLAFAFDFMSEGKTFVQGTILPSPTSTDGFLTVENQKPDEAAWEPVRLEINQWLRDLGPNGFMAQADEAVSGMAGAGNAYVVDPCAGIACDALGLTDPAGAYVRPSVTPVMESGSSSAGNTLNTFNDTSKSWKVNAYVGYDCYIVSGTGAGQTRCIGYNTANQLGILNCWSVIPDATSKYEIFRAVGMNTVHPTTLGHILAAGAINARAVVR